MHEPACGEMLRDVFFRYPCNANPGQSSLDHQVDVAKRHRAIDVDTRALAPVRQIPSVQRAALEAKANATVTGKIVRRLRGPATGQAGEATAAKRMSGPKRIAIMSRGTSSISTSLESTTNST